MMRTHINLAEQTDAQSGHYGGETRDETEACKSVREARPVLVRSGLWSVSCASASDPLDQGVCGNFFDIWGTKIC